MTDAELAGKLEWNAKHGSHAFPPLLYAAADRIYALSAHVALLKASLAQAEREAEKPTASAEPSEDLVRFCPGCGHVGPSPDGYLDCCSDGDKARSLPKALAEICHELFVLARKGASEPSADPVAWVDVIDRHEGPYNFHGMALMDSGKHQLYAAPQPDRVAELTAEVERLRNLLGEAADEIQNWGAYASEYFQEKHDLAGCVAEFKAAALAGNEAQS